MFSSADSVALAIIGIKLSKTVGIIAVTLIHNVSGMSRFCRTCAGCSATEIPPNAFVPSFHQNFQTRVCSSSPFIVTLSKNSDGHLEDALRSVDIAPCLMLTAAQNNIVSLLSKPAVSEMFSSLIALYVMVTALFTISSLSLFLNSPRTVFVFFI